MIPVMLFGKRDGKLYASFQLAKDRQTAGAIGAAFQEQYSLPEVLIKGLAPWCVWLCEKTPAPWRKNSDGRFQPSNIPSSA